MFMKFIQSKKQARKQKEATQYIKQAEAKEQERNKSINEKNNNVIF